MRGVDGAPAAAAALGESAPSTAEIEVDLPGLMEQFRGRMSDASLTSLIEIGAQGNPRVHSSLVWLCTNSMGQQLMLSIGDSVDGDAIVSAVETLRATTDAAPSLVDEGRETLGKLQQLEHVQRLKTEGARVLEEHASEYHAMQDNISGLLAELRTSDEAEGLTTKSSELLTTLKNSEQLSALMAKATALVQGEKAQSLLQSAMGSGSKAAIERISAAGAGEEGAGPTDISARMLGAVAPLQTRVTAYAESEKFQAMASQAAEYLPSVGDKAASLLASGNTLVSQLRESQQGQAWMRKGVQYLETHGDDLQTRGLALLEQVDVEGAFEYGTEGEFSFMYRYISRESCSQFDSLPLTSLTICQDVVVSARVSARVTVAVAVAPRIGDGGARTIVLRVGVGDTARAIGTRRADGEPRRGADARCEAGPHRCRRAICYEQRRVLLHAWAAAEQGRGEPPLGRQRRRARRGAGPGAPRSAPARPPRLTSRVVEEREPPVR